MVSPCREHRCQWLEEAAVLIKHVCVLRKLLRNRIEATKHEHLPLRIDTVPRLIRKIELVGYHDSLSHVVGDLVGVNELSALLQIKDAWVYSLVEGVLELKLSREVLREKGRQLRIDVICRTRVGETEVVVVAVNGEVFGDDVVELVNHRRHRLDLVCVH